MASVSWMIQRLRAMSIPEIFWRLSQKIIQKKEEQTFRKKSKNIISKIYNEELALIELYPERLHLNYANHEFNLNTGIHLLAGANYEVYKKAWNAGFQTDNVWPDTFSYNLEYKQKDDIGDARTNWELNRHFQFALLAKDYYASRDERYLKELEEIFDDWNEKNAFLHGISWTSVMEIAIRCSNWVYTYCFLARTDVTEELLEKIRIGIINMTDYIAKHYSRYSSANNHLIVEAYAIGQSGIVFDHKEWIDLAVNLLTKELPLQNYSDGINKELSLHYQSFYMEAMGLMMRLLMKNGLTVPSSWKPMLRKMCEYVSCCIGKYQEVIEFGDDDEGKILDLMGRVFNYHQYVLQLLGILFGKKYIDVELNENIRWLFGDEEIALYLTEEMSELRQYCIYKDGGNSILRSADNEVLIGIDHSALGYGSIAAHGHADALSFQIFYKGKPLFIDPGTYIYHYDLKNRNEFRKTRNHNTVCIDDKDQSEMLGAFLWGRKANAKLLSVEKNNEKIELVMKQDGYYPINHIRIISFDGNRYICIKDQISSSANAFANYLLAPDIEVAEKMDELLLSHGHTYFASLKYKGGHAEVISHDYSDQYGLKQSTKGIHITFDKECLMEVVLI